MCATLPDRRFEAQHLLTLLAMYAIPHWKVGVGRIFRTGNIQKKSNWGYMFRQGMEMSFPR